VPVYFEFSFFLIYSLTPLETILNNPTAPTLFQRVFIVWQHITRALDALQPLAALAARLYVAYAFFLSGLTKLRDWGTTVALFTDEYKVPFLSPEVAAAMGTAGELALPVLLVLGLGGRFAALGLSVINVVAVISLSEIAPAALQQHITWGILLAGLAIYGCGKYALDQVIVPKVFRGAMRF
jgi:putative oxidoreductase